MKHVYWLCRLLGHKFVGKNSLDDFWYEIVPTTFCVRCGLNMNEIKENE